MGKDSVCGLCSELLAVTGKCVQSRWRTLGDGNERQWKVHITSYVLCFYSYDAVGTQLNTTLNSIAFDPLHNLPISERENAMTSIFVYLNASQNVPFPVVKIRLL